METASIFFNELNVIHYGSSVLSLMKEPIYCPLFAKLNRSKAFSKGFGSGRKKLGFSFLNWGQDDKIGLKMLIIPSFFRDKISNFANGNPQNYF